MILVYDLKIFAWRCQILLGILHGDAKFSREFYMGIPNSLGNFAWGCQIPCSMGATKNTEGVPKPLGDLTRGGAKFSGVPVSE